jgi:hypothetical protein
MVFSVYILGTVLTTLSSSSLNLSVCYMVGKLWCCVSQVASRNYVSLTVVKDGAGADTGLPEEPRVSHLAFIGNGDWLATVQVRTRLCHWCMLSLRLTQRR